MGKKRIVAKSVGGTGSVQEGISKTSLEKTAESSRMKIQEGRVYVFSSYNNTMMSLIDTRGNMLFSTSAGALGFHGTKKSTPFAASKVAETLAQVAAARGLEKVDVYMKGIGPGRDSALRSLGTKRFEIRQIKDITPIPYNGPRPPKARRV